MPKFEEKVNSYIDGLNAELENERIKRVKAENILGELDDVSPLKNNSDSDLVRYQLELEKELTDFYNFLKGMEIKVVDGNQKWVESDDDRLKVFSDYGVKRLTNLIKAYVNKNKLLSFYKLDMITWKMHDFSIELFDMINNSYELIFNYPSPEDLFEKYLGVFRNEIAIDGRVYLLSDEQLDLFNNPFSVKIPQYKEVKVENGKVLIQKTEDLIKDVFIKPSDLMTRYELYNKCILWSDEELQRKIVNFPSIALAIVDMVHDTYLRALEGKERSSLREKLNIFQRPNQDDKQGVFNNPGGQKW